MSDRQLTVVATGSVRTADVDPLDRVEYWESYNTQVLIGLRCNTYASDGLSAEQSNFDVGDIKLADIRANAHFIERTRELVETRPKESVFASLLVEGSAFFYCAEGCIPVHAGQVIVYDTISPYLFAFGTPMRQILIDVPRDALQEHFGSSSLRRPIVGDPTVKGAVALADLLNVARDENLEPRLCTPKALLDAVGTVSGLSGDLSALRIQQARSFIESAVSGSELTADDVARAVGVSLRHLNRTFTDSGTSVSRLIRERRLERAISDLHTFPDTSIADIATKWGFSSHAQFSTLVRHRYGMTPSALRQQM
ncbi:helix-turn-helix domain-containing protein [Mycobacterium sp. AT1]|uniref:helix-turn-helix domain-containing protein n=1 Tax=Mycobacterium sp. AT1 TaxID=1961706 RepID=UPI0009AD73A3|nr:helix-turn-helix domain-containing protein [Mycobacterium sp. AT1]OPX10803.1 hypothetical protein B1790_10645 [Mycobacterium sp. AT1]